MKKIGKRFVALVVVFVSIMSFLPIQLGLNGHAANAVDSTATDIEVRGDGTTGGTVDSSKKPIYSTTNQSAYFSITVKDLIKNKTLIAVNETAITDQKVIITSINRIRLDDQTTYDDNITTLKAMGVTFDDSDPTFGENYQSTTDDKRLGAKIIGLPLGVNEIKYRVEVTENTLIQKDPNDTSTQQFIENITKGEEKTINIEHANNFVQSQIPYVDFVDYVGGRIDTNSESNATPFKYTERMESSAGGNLRFKHDLPNSVTDMDYKISFPNGIDTDVTKYPDNDIVFVNGSQQTSISTNVDSDGKPILTGSLQKTATSTIILISIRHKDSNGNYAIRYTYAVEIQYNTKDAKDDYALKSAGITKLNYNADSSIKAYIGKEFTTTPVSSTNSVLTYTGNITIDKYVGMISLEPIIGRSSADTAFKISNHYDSQTADSKLINGKQYIDFAKGTSNEIWLEVYEGKDGNVTGSLLAIYKLKVNLVGSGNSTVAFSFDSNTILTQPGRTADKAISFSADRRTYDLYSKNSSTTSVSVTLDNPSTNDKNSKRREYIKAWGGTSVQSDAVTEIALDKSISPTIDVSSYKKIILQAYYDQTVYKKDAPDEVESITAYPIGQSYTFYIAANADKADSDTTTNSSNASLSNIVVANGNIKSTDGTSGYSSDKTNYKVTVPKADTSSNITITAADGTKVNDITATIAETGDEYSLTSGQGFDFPLNSSGTTNINIVVTAQDGVTKKTYNITVSNDTRSATSLLKNVVTDKGDFTFDADADPNKIRVDQAVNTLKVAPIPEDSKAKVTVNGEKYSGTPIEVDLKGSQETDMEIKVTSEDGSSSKTYSFEIYRTDTALDTEDDSSNDSDVFYDDIDDCWVDTSKYEEWGTVKGKQVYFNNKGRQVKNQWINTKNTWYYLDSKGYKSTGWRKDIGGKTYYLDPSTGELKKGWLYQNNKWYYLGLNGVMQKGWLNLNGKWYYFTPEGEMITNQSMYIDDGVYRFAQDGSIY